MKYLGPISDPKDIVNKEYVDNNTPTITISTSEPTSADGQNGDIWLVYSSN